MHDKTFLILCMDGQDWFLIIAASTLLVIVIVLISTNRKADAVVKSQGTMHFNVVQSGGTTNFVPRVYSILYVKRDPNNSNVWLFSKDDASIRHFVADINSGAINHLLIYGRFFKIESIGDDSSNYHLTLKPLCDENQSKMFMNCSTNMLYTNGTATLLHVLGYSF